ncbi:MAG TPA: hypothetical protein VJN18_11320 [Polyangiaceae bacterium]|nr:hypothetical protein [Polyangiaceae bacterium]
MLAELEQNAAAEISIGNETERIVVRLQLDVLVALDVLDASLDELTFWAFRALTDARRVEAIPASVLQRATYTEWNRFSPTHSEPIFDARAALFVP